MKLQSLIALLLCLCALPSLAEKFDFDVLLNDKLIGRHQINLSIDATGKTIVEGKANYTIKLLGITVFGYQHQHREVWEDNCLNSLASTTRSNGGLEQLTLNRHAQGYALSTLDQDRQLTFDQLSCAWSYAYWRKGFTSQQQLMNGQTGEFSNVSIKRLPLEMPIKAGASQDSASAMPPASVAQSPTAGAGDRYQLVTKDQTIIVSYSPAGRWNGLNVELASNRVLTYRPRSTR